MNRIKKLFEKKRTGILSVYFTAGYPALNDTHRIIKGLTQQGVDMIEIGIPFSDPVADGPVIQKSSQIALSNGMSLDLLFRQLENIYNKTALLRLFFYSSVSISSCTFPLRILIISLT